MRRQDKGGAVFWCRLSMVFGLFEMLPSQSRGRRRDVVEPRVDIEIAVMCRIENLGSSIISRY